MYQTRTFLRKTFDAGHIFQMDIEDNFPKILSKKTGEKIHIIVVGAWHGDEIQSFLRFYNVHIWAFEPNPANFAYLEKRYAGNPHVSCFNIACGESEKTLPLYEANLTGNDSLLPIREGASIQTKKVHQVRVKRLDSIIELQNIPIDLLWADVQGYELSVLKGTEKLLHNIQSMFLEINEPDGKYAGATRSSDLEKFLDENNFYNAHQETSGKNKAGNAFFLRKNIKTDFFTDTKTLEKRITVLFENRRKTIILSNNFLYSWFSLLLPASFRASVKKLMNI